MGRRREPFIYKPRDTGAATGFYHQPPQGESRKSQVKKTYLAQGRQDALDHALRLGIKPSTVGAWVWNWGKEKDNKQLNQVFAREFARLEQLAKTQGLVVACNEAPALFGVSAQYLEQVYGSRSAYEAMQRMTDQLVVEAGVLTTEE